MMTMIRADQVSYRYVDQHGGLPETSLAVMPGETWLVSGSSGSGKSTLARCLQGLIPHLYRGTMTGRVLLNDFPTDTTPMWKLAEQAGMVFQNPSAQILGETVALEIIFGLEQLGWETRHIEERLEAVLATFQLGAMRERSPHTLSDGEKQKLALAAVMARQPAALILDEPLSMLDVTAAGELIQELERIRREGTAVVLFEHREAQLRMIAGLQQLDLEGAPHLSTPEGLNPPWESGVPFQVHVRDLGVTLGGRRILDQLNIDLQGGELVAIVGRNGTGKTTLLRSMIGLQKHDGVVELNGHGEDLDMGLVFQNPDLQLFNPTVRDELRFRIPFPDETLYRWILDVLALSPYEHTPPLLLSEGEKKRLGLGVVLMRQPRHGILLDEPSLGQDARHRAILMRMLRAMSDQGRLVMLTTHDLDLARQADRVILLGQEGIAADGPSRDIFSRPALWESVGLKMGTAPERGLAS